MIFNWRDYLRLAEDLCKERALQNIETVKAIFQIYEEANS